MAAVLECCDDMLTVEFIDQCEFQDSDARVVTIENVQLYQYFQGSVRRIAVVTATMRPKYAMPVLYQYHMPMIC